MLPCHGLRFLVAVSISFVFGAFARCEQPTPDTPQPTPPAKQVRTDLYGDPLPPGAILRLGTVRFRHEFAVKSVAFSPEGKTLASASFDKTVRLWETATGKEIHQLQGHQGWVYFVAFSPDGKTLATAGDDQTVRLWDVASGKQVVPFTLHLFYRYRIGAASGRMTIGHFFLTVRTFIGQSSRTLPLSPYLPCEHIS